MKIKTLLLATSIVVAFTSTILAQSVIVRSGDAIEESDDSPGQIVLDVDQQPRFHEYVIREHHRSIAYDHPVAIGSVLPDNDIEYYDVPTEYGHAHEYRYTVLNNRTVIVDPRTRRVVEVIN